MIVLRRLLGVTNDDDLGGLSQCSRRCRGTECGCKPEDEANHEATLGEGRLSSHFVAALGRRKLSRPFGEVSAGRETASWSWKSTTPDAFGLVIVAMA